ncbi:FCD domain-containing protein [Arenibaculum pallidiluteum]|uniref:FCD domain-containing protein n=1 Tax=Arenibaculum pallidiluteum TaxID=2812559 RepID=UPI001A96EA79|nr:FCD domain-containing protein [Arenibaculum pallidiluteum]
MKNAETAVRTDGKADREGSLRERAYRLLRGMIEDGQIKRGERLLEAEIVRAFGISRSPARQALKWLCRDGLVEELPGRGYRVAGAPAGTVGDAVLDPVKISTPRQWERMYKEVEQQLFAQTLFGSVRINEQRLAQHFDVSRTVTRDLLARMHGFGLVTKDSAGHWIAGRMNPDRIRDLYEMRWLLEPPALLQAARIAPRATLAAMRDHVVATRAASPIDSAEFNGVEKELHIDLLGLCPNQEILSALRRTHLLFGPTRYLFDPYLGIPIEMIEDALNEHLAIIDLLLAGQPERAAEALRTHLVDAVDRWLRRFEITRRMSPQQCPPWLAQV